VLIAMVLLSRLIWIDCAEATPAKATPIANNSRGRENRTMGEPPERAAEE
jgi:hypothetical protein